MPSPNRSDGGAGRSDELLRKDYEPSQCRKDLGWLWSAPSNLGIDLWAHDLVRGLRSL